MVWWLLQMRVTLVSAQLEVGVRPAAPLVSGWSYFYCYLVYLSDVGC